MIKITIPKALTRVGQAYFYNVAQAQMDGANVKVNNVTNMTEIKTYVFDNAYTLPELFTLVSNGGDTEGLETFITMPKAKLTNQIPVGLPNRSYTTGEGDDEVTHIRTWENWRDGNHPIRYNIADTEAAFGLNTFGVCLNISQIKLINDLDDSTIKIFLEDDYITEMAKTTWTVEA